MIRISSKVADAKKKYLSLLLPSIAEMELGSAFLVKSDTFVCPYACQFESSWIALIKLYPAIISSAVLLCGNVRFGSVAASRHLNSATAPFECIADVRRHRF